MATVYILFSPSIDRFYVGSCLNLDARLKEHKCKHFKHSYTTRTDDWEVFLSIDNLHQQQARNIEDHIKKMKSKIYIFNLRKYPELIEKLVKIYS